jgi:16S rRNA (cytidine1402-2'-O)-methyltransferase
MAEGVLFVVATPIGNLEDVTLRALRVLGEAELLLAEDTRRTRVLLDRHGIAGRPRSLHAHNERARIAEVIAALEAGQRVALVSDAGTPLLSDPGERLVAAAITAGQRVEPVPGPSAPIAALVASGLPTTPFTFAGFLPRRAGERDALLASLRERPDTLVFFESPRRLAATLERLLELLGDRQACVARELTKRHEELVRGTLGELAAHFAEAARGEITLVVAGAGDAATEPLDEESVAERVRALIADGLPTRDIAARLAPETGWRRRDLYALAARLRN